MLKKLTIVLILCNLQICLFAQNNAFDSLENLLVQHSDKDTNRIILLNTLSYKVYTIDLDKTFKYANEADSLSEALNYKKGKAESQRLIGIYYLYKGDYSKALTHYQISLKINEEIHSKRGIAIVISNIATVFQVHGDYTQAIDYNIKALKLLELLHEKMRMGICYLNLGEIYANQGNFPLGLEYNWKAIKIFEAYKDLGLQSRSFGNIGIIYYSQGNYPKALEYTQKALKISEKQGAKSITLYLSNSLGDIYKKQNNVSKALEYYQKSMKLAEEIGDKNGIITILANIGEVYLQHNKFIQASENYQKGLKLSLEIKAKPLICNSYLAIGNLYQKQNELNKALENYQKALQITEETNEKDKICFIYFGMAASYLKQQNLSSALNYSLKSLEIAEDLKMLDFQSKIHLQLSEIYEKTGNFKQAYTSYKIYKILNDSVFSKENQNKITGLEFQYKYEQERQTSALAQQKKDAEQSLSYNRHKYLNIMFSIILFFICLGAYFELKNHRKMKKANKLLDLKNSMLEQKREEILIINEELKTQKEEILAINEELNTQKEELILANREVTDSIQSAKRIQDALLPSTEILLNNLPDYFIFFKPRDIVSGDFYWFKQIKNFIFIAAADCTGHGIPGAFMSMLGLSLLDDIVNKRDVNPPNEILNELRKRLKKSLHQAGQEGQTHEGMDIAFCTIDMENKVIQYSGANNPLYVVRKSKNDDNFEISETKADRMPIGVHPRDEQSFTNYEIHIEKGDTIYIFSDGYISQFGGQNNKTFKTKRFQEVLLKIQNENMETQKQILEQTLSDWQGKNEQVDDIMVIGVKF